KGDAVGVIVVHVNDAGHVASAGPALEFAAVILVKAGEAATGDHRLEALVEDGRENRVMAPEGVTDRADVLAVNLLERLEKVDAAAIIVDGLAAAAAPPAIRRQVL